MTQSVSPTILGTGLFALDMVVNPEGELVEAGLGGSAGNVLAILAELGWSTIPVANLGDDKAAKHLINEMTSLKADLRFVKTLSANCTPIIYQHLHTPKADATHSFSFTCPVCGERHSPSMSQRVTQESGTVIGRVSPNVYYFDRASALNVELAEHFKNCGALIYFEPSTIGDDCELFSRSVKAAHIVKYADERLADLAEFPLDDVAVEICTQGRHGLRFRAPSLSSDWIQLGALEAPWIVDTSGAGDWCTAGMLFRLFSDLSFDIRNLTYNQLSHALRFGQSLSALNCMTLGARGLVKSMTGKKITSTGQQLEEVIFKSSSGKMPDPSWLAYELRRDRQRSTKAYSSFHHFRSVCCSALP
ncbi:hypothetical protein [Herbaspirillum seropedicae]|uniref:hypothetical protein n=1 Tax=Herbaspirillum seropedicae TaxID=964 RepID=UPI000863A58C|nr:hypothetical protein [Herbaspirillum seropedicae]AON52323.1 Ribokinase pfkB-like superfamily [Herbaspirillum seropedicae]